MDLLVVALLVCSSKGLIRLAWLGCKQASANLGKRRVAPLRR